MSHINGSENYEHSEQSESQTVGDVPNRLPRQEGIQYVDYNLPVATPPGGWDNPNVAESLKPTGLDRQFGHGSPAQWTNHGSDSENNG